MSRLDHIAVNQISHWLLEVDKSKYRYPAVASIRIIELLEAILEKLEDEK